MYEELSESSKQGEAEHREEREREGCTSTSQIKIKSNKLCDMKRSSSNTRVRLPFDWGAATSLQLVGEQSSGGEGERGRQAPHCIQCVEILGMLSVHDKRLDADVAVLFRRSMLQK